LFSPTRLSEKTGRALFKRFTRWIRLLASSTKAEGRSSSPEGTRVKAFDRSLMAVAALDRLYKKGFHPSITNLWLFTALQEPHFSNIAENETL